MYFSRILAVLATSVLVSAAPMGDSEGTMTTPDSQMKHGHNTDGMMPSIIDRHPPPPPWKVRSDTTMIADGMMDCQRADGCRGMAATDMNADAELAQDMRGGR